VNGSLIGEWQLASTKAGFAVTESSTVSSLAKAGDPVTPGGTKLDHAYALKWGIFHVHGNVWEWTQDCWHENYAGAPE
jgi:formylglycine-generating enzyme required for sulfatase activity